MTISVEELRGLPAAARVGVARFGGPSNPQSRVVNVLTSRTELFQGNPNRVYGFAMNRAIGNGAVDFDTGLTYANGIRIAPDGGYLELDPEKIGELVGWPWFAIMEAAAGNWRVWEVVVET